MITQLPFIKQQVGEFVPSTYLKKGHDTTKGLQVVEAEYIEFIYKEARYNQSKAAKMLGVSRNTLRYKLQRYFGDKYIISVK